MDSTTMISVAIVTGIIAIAVVTVKKWLDQYRLEQMRKSHIDSINMTSNVGSVPCAHGIRTLVTAAHWPCPTDFHDNRGIRSSSPCRHAPLKH